ncbi:cutinase family protein [Mycetocola saprophilus]|uniref:cutinase family protein n=1 Tax=Mycetocola saprophilus TaxID=76636 RepID=UPI0012DD31A8|nr:cutinase family protein [Mycetocola saprophilus]
MKPHTALLAVGRRLLSGSGAPRTVRAIGRSFLSMVVVCGALALPAVVAPVPVQAASLPRFSMQNSATCTPVAILAFRGSGEANLAPGVSALEGAPTLYPRSGRVTNGWEGPTLARLVDALGGVEPESGWPAGFSIGQVPVLGVGGSDETGYTAVPIQARTTIFDDMIDSAAHGATYAERVMRDFAATQPVGCRTRYIAIGYSQGAMAARTLAQALPGQVSAILTFGDPYQQPAGAGNEREIAGQGIIRWWMGEQQRTRTDGFYNFAGYKSALCHPRDPVCSYSWLWGLGALLTVPEPHLNYLEGLEGAIKARELAEVAAALWAGDRPAGPVAPSPAPRDGIADASAPHAAPAPAPLPALNSATTGLVGQSMVLGAESGLPLGAAVHYEYDTTGDGTFDRASDSPLLEMVFQSPGEHTVTVRMSAPDLGTITLTRTITILERAVPAPASSAASDLGRGCRGDPMV